MACRISSGSGADKAKTATSAEAFGGMAALEQDLALAEFFHVDGGAQAEHGRGIDHVLAGGAPVHKIGGVFVLSSYQFAKLVDQMDGQIAGEGGGFA